MLRQIKYFQAVVRCGSFTEAAEKCYISQSAVSQQIKALEKELGVSLLERQNRRFTVTPAGEYFYKKSLSLTADFDKLCMETAKIAHNDKPRLMVGYLKDYSSREFQQAVAEFAERYPDTAIDIMNGNHEELYEELRFGRVDLVLNDQRRAFSDEYVNVVLATAECCIEISGRSSVAEKSSVNAEELKDIPCILVASQGQRDNEQTYYREVVGIKSDFIFAENLEEARLLVIGGKSFMPVDSSGKEFQFGTPLRHIPLLRGGRPIKRNYCAFWKTSNSGYYVEKFADILKEKFSEVN